MGVYSIAAAAGGTGLAPTRFGSGSPHSVLDSGRRHEGARVVWRVQCGDLISRDRCVAVYVDDGEVVLVGPPGEAARLSADQLWQLRAALNEAAELAER
ncbi:hypothetical protein [Saccharomonospora piscinae]|uniref:hypothetical protein n=1 Tax=Saccharomonospora piscinae TaxID=687388 RepID=UPI003B8462E2